MRRRFFFILCGLLVTGCATGKTEQRVDNLEAQLTSLQRDQALARVRLDEINRLSQSVFILQDRVEQMSLELERAQTEIVAMDAQPAEVPRIEQVAPVKAPKAVKPANAPLATGPAPSKGVTRDDAVTAYREAYELLKNGDYVASRGQFMELLQRFPRHDLSDNAQYWLGEIDYVTRDYRGALKAFERVITEYPHGNKVPDALLKMAFCHQELGQNDLARSNLERILREFSWSDPAKKAKERLQLLGEEATASAPNTEDS